MLSFVPNGPPGVISSRGGRIGPSPVLGAKFDPGTDRVNRKLIRRSGEEGGRPCNEQGGEGLENLYFQWTSFVNGPLSQELNVYFHLTDIALI